ncbi:MAG: YitT family protein [Oscillospiraceae bacterium]
MKRKMLDLFWMTLGTALVSVGVYFFKFPNHFSMGGVSGLSILLGQVIHVPFLTPSVFNSIINIVFLLLGFALLNRGFGFKTIYCSLLYSLLVQLFELIYPMSQPLTDQKMLELFFAVILPALGSGILFNINASTGGTDIAAMILKKFTGLDVGRALLCSDVIIAGATLFIFDIETGLFSLLGLVLKSVLVDTVIESLNRRKSFTIITSQPEIAKEYITQKLHRGATVWNATGAYTGEEHTVILAALSRAQAVALRSYLKQADPSAFLLITNSSEIFGKGFLRA